MTKTCILINRISMFFYFVATNNSYIGIKKKFPPHSRQFFTNILSLKLFKIFSSSSSVCSILKIRDKKFTNKGSQKNCKFEVHYPVLDNNI